MARKENQKADADGRGLLSSSRSESSNLKVVLLGQATRRVEIKSPFKENLAKFTFESGCPKVEKNTPKTERQPTK